MKLAAFIKPKDDGYVALCPLLDIASQGDSAALALKNLKEDLNQFLERASDEEISRRLREVYVMQVDVSATGDVARALIASRAHLPPEP